MPATEGPATYRISELGALTGFTPTTLRYYEEAGILASPARTPTGYRIYGDRDVERLRLVARAKDLGCRLDEIRDLVEAWDADECAPVRHRLRSLVDAKIDQIERHVDGQLRFAAQLRATAAALRSRPVDGPCDDTCGCASASPPPGTTGTPATEARTSVPVDLLPRRPAPVQAPVACALEGSEVDARIDAWRDALRDAGRREAIPGGLRLTVAPASLADITALAAAEQGCCPFFAFAITLDGRGAALEVTAPADGQPILHDLFGTAG